MNFSEEKSKFFDEMDRAVELLIKQASLSEEEAFIFASQIGDLLSDEGELPKMPDDMSGPQAFKRWNDAVRLYNFPRRVAKEYLAGGYDG